MKTETRAFLVEYDDIPENVPMSVIPAELARLKGGKIFAIGTPKDVEDPCECCPVCGSDAIEPVDVREATKLEFTMTPSNVMLDRDLRTIVDSQSIELYDLANNRRNVMKEIADAFDAGDTVNAVYNLLVAAGQMSTISAHVAKQQLYKVLDRSK